MELSGMCVKVINLDRRPDRWQRFSSQLGVKELETKYKVDRFSAVDGKTLDVMNDDRISMRTKRNIKMRSRRTHEDIDTVGAIGCYLSHVQIWKEFLTTSASCVLVLEDDALIPPHFVHVLEACARDLQQVSGYDECLWSLAYPQAFFERDSNTYREGVWIKNVATTFTGYILFRKAAEKLVEICMPIDNHVDLMVYQATQLGIISMIHHPKLLLHQIAVQRGDSNIQENKCVLCDVPNRPEKKGYWIISPRDQQRYVIGFVVAGLVAGSYYMFGYPRRV
jgi:GR25 family glycosyltransferase involved in LPS biosynthesis